ncbi:MAG TPA: hypothetical protein VM536_09455 [Chloroflexia bacterium]|nr:hypothetical protein [Chloroflexia bacterium]
MADWALDDSVLEAYIRGFYGHGATTAPYWFIGMEFGGGKSPEEIVTRIQGWYDRGRHEREDFVRGTTQWSTDHPPLQSTWAKLIRVVLSAEGDVPNKEQLRDYQRDCLGRAGGLDCLLELLPLPSPGLNKWLYYPELSKLPYLQSRALYTEHVMLGRIAHLQHMIADHKPRAVVFYGSGYEYWWSQIAGTDFAPSRMPRVAVARNAHTRFVSMLHPVAFGVKDSYFDAIGRLIAAGEPEWRIVPASAPTR